MKKIYLMMLAGAISFAAQAQQATTRSVVTSKLQQVEKPNVNTQAFWGAKANASSTANKGTAGGSRWYNYVDHRYLLDPAIANNDNYPYMWNTPYGQSIYAGPVLDTVYLSTEAMVIHPQFGEWNDIAAYPGEIEVTNSNAYTLDSIKVYGVYGRNAAKPNVVDTLVIAATYGNGTGTSNIPIYYFSNLNSIDTVRFSTLFIDTNNNRATGASYNMANVVVRKIPLTAAALNDTTPGGLNVYGAAINLAVPAGNIFGASVSFKTGDNYIAGDTIFAGSVTPTRPFKYGMFRPSVYEIKDGQFATSIYTKTPRNYNNGLFNQRPFSTIGWDDIYIPMYAWSNAATTLELPNIDFKITCPTCNKLSNIKDRVTNIASSAYPNPANDAITISYKLNTAAKVSITVTNALGQKVAVQELGRVSAGTTQVATINTSNLVNGVYFYTIEAEGQRSAQRFVIAH